LKLGIVSDPHGDPTALELACSRLTDLGAERIVCAGDLTGYGPDPNGVVAIIKERQITTVRGNHDRWAIERELGSPDTFGGGQPGEEALQYLRELEPHAVIAAAEKVAVIVHGSPYSDMDYVIHRTHPPHVLRRYLEVVKADFLIVGHTHEPMWFRCKLGLVINPGSTITAPVVRSSRSFALLATDAMDVRFYEVDSGRRLELRPWYEAV
jgi:putative phosphoesterase